MHLIAWNSLSSLQLALIATLSARPPEVTVMPNARTATADRIGPSHSFHPQHLSLFIHSSHFYSAPSSPLPLRGAPDYSTDTVSEFHAEAHRQLQAKDLPKVPT